MIADAAAIRRCASLILPAALLVAGCGKADSDPGPGGVTVGEARTLDEAAAKLDRQRLPTGALTASPLPSPSPGAQPAQ